MHVVPIHTNLYVLQSTHILGLQSWVADTQVSIQATLAQALELAHAFQQPSPIFTHGHCMSSPLQVPLVSGRLNSNSIPTFSTLPR